MSPDGSSVGVSRRRFLMGAGGGALVAGAALAEGFIFEPARLHVSHHSLGEPRSGLDPIRLAVLTDLHLRALGALHEKLERAVAEAEPDVILLVGDSIDRSDNLPLLREFLETLPASAQRYATVGNWEYWAGVDPDALRRTYEARDTRLLVNESVELGPLALLYGLDDSLAGRPNLSRLPTDRDAEVLLLSHCPGFRDELSSADGHRIRAMISGHTHGGQVAFRGWAPLRPPGSGRYVSGWYSGGGPDLFVSRGLGTSLLPLRVGSVPELAVIDWHVPAQ